MTKPKRRAKPVRAWRGWALVMKSGHLYVDLSGMPVLFGLRKHVYSRKLGERAVSVEIRPVPPKRRKGATR